MFSMIASLNQIALSEGALLGEKLGLDPATLLSIINSSSKGRFSFLCPSPFSLSDLFHPIVHSNAHSHFSNHLLTF
jgi:3-hydroxyisobutyrate dehydrogenase-like beta-hydroxyacid dehydrogenase